MADFDFQQYVQDNMAYEGSPGGTLRVSCVDTSCDDNWKQGRHLYIYPEGLPYCFKCQQKFDPVRFVMLFEECSLATAQKRVLENTPRPKRVESPLEDLMRAYKAPPPEISEAKPDVHLPQSVPIEPDDAAWNYLAGRGFGKDIIDHFNLSFCPPYTGEFSGRILIPVYFCGKVVGYQGRTIAKKDPKYLFPPGDDGSKHLYGWDEAVAAVKPNPAGSRFIMLVEGITDMWRCWLYGYKNTVATFGKALKPNQRRLILAEKEIDGVMLFWDGNAADEIEKVADDLREHKQVYVVDLPLKAEPDTVSPEEMYQLILSATHWNSLSTLDKLRRKLGRLPKK
jgi:DNA primase